MAEWLEFLTVDYEVPGSNPAGGRTQLMTARRFLAQTILSSRYDLNYVERDVKHQINSGLS